MFDPEPRLTPPDDPPLYIADCKHEVPNGDDIEVRRGESGGVYEWEGRLICPDCARELTEKMTLKELMEKLGARFIKAGEKK